VSRLLWGVTRIAGRADHSSHAWSRRPPSEGRRLLWTLGRSAWPAGVALGRFNQSCRSSAPVGFVAAMAMFAVYLGGIRVYTRADEQGDRPAHHAALVDIMYKSGASPRCAGLLSDRRSATTPRIDCDSRIPYELPGDTSRTSPARCDRAAAEMIAFFAVGVYRGVWRIRPDGRRRDRQGRLLAFSRASSSCCTCNGSSAIRERSSHSMLCCWSAR